MANYHLPDSVYLSPVFLKIWDAYARTLKQAKGRYEYFLCISTLCNYLHCDFLEVTLTAADNFFQWEASEKKLSVKTLNTHISVCRSVASFIEASREDFNLPDYRNIFSGITVERYSEYLSPAAIPTIAEMDKILESAEDKPMLFLIFTLVIRCALSNKNLCALQAEHFQTDKSNRMFLTIDQNRLTQRHIKIPDDVAEILCSYCENTGISAGPLLVNNRGGRLTSNLLCKTVQTHMQNAGFTYSLQDLRNASITHMLAGGASAADTAEYAGISERWMYRYRDVIDALDTAPCDYQHFTIKHH